MGNPRKLPTRALHPDLPLYQRQPDEVGHAFHAFQHYRDMPFNERSLDVAFRIHRVRCLEKIPSDTVRVPGSWGAWCSSWSWVKRAQAYDDEKDRVTVAVEVARSETWAQAKVSFREVWRNDMQSLYGRLKVRVNEMLEFPIAEKVVEDEEDADERGIIVRRTVWMPVKWRYADVARALAMMMVLGTTIAGTPEDEQTEEEALRRWAEREGIPFEDAASEYRRIKREMQEGSG